MDDAFQSRTGALPKTGELCQLLSLPFQGWETDQFEIRVAAGSHYVGIDQGGRPALILVVEGLQSTLGKRVGCIRISHQFNLRVRHLGDELSIDAIVLECLEHGLMATFSALALDILGQLGQAETSAREVKGALVVWEKLLRTRDPLLLNEQQGLWGEIQLLSRLPDLERALACWRGPEKGVVDFFGNGISLEVKTGTRPLHHTLRWHQALFGENNADVYLVSIHIQEDPTGGETLPELIGKVQSQLESNIELFRLLLKVGYREEHAESYERRFSMVVEPRFVPMVDVPSIRDLPKGVTSVHWDVDISVDSVLGSSVSEDVCRKMMGDYYE